MDTSDSFLLTDSQDSHESTGLVSPDRLRVSSQLSNLSLSLSGLTHAEITTDSFSLSNSTLLHDQHNLSASPNAPPSAKEDPQDLSEQSHLSDSANVTTIPDSQASQQPSDSGSDAPAPPTDYDGRNRNTSTSDNTLMQVNLTQANAPPDEATLAPVIRDLFKKMENSLSSVLQSSQESQEIARLHGKIADLKCELSFKDSALKRLKEDTAAKNSLTEQCEQLERRLEAVTKAKQSLECKLQCAEVTVQECRKHIASLEDINRILLSNIAPPICQETPDTNQAASSAGTDDVNIGPPTATGVSQSVHRQQNLSESREQSLTQSEPLRPNQTESHPPQAAAQSALLAPALSPSQPPQADTQPNQPVPPAPSPSQPHHHTTLSPPPDPVTDAAASGMSASTDAESAKSLAPQPMDILFVGNSQFRHLNPSRLYRDKVCRVHVLQQKTLDGAQSFFENFRPETSPTAICLQIISNTMENTLDANLILNKTVTLITTINRNSPGSQIFIGLPLPRMCSTPDLTAKYEICRDQVEDRIKNLAAKRHNISAVWSHELGSYSRELFADNKHLTHQPSAGSGGRTGLGLLVRAFKAAMNPLQPDRDRPRGSQRDTINWQPVRTHLARRPLQQTDPRPYYHQARSGGNRRQDWRVYDSRPYYNNRSRTYRDTRVGGHDSHRKDRNEDNYRNDRREDSPINPYPHEQPASAVQYDYHYDTQHVVSRNDEQFHIPQRAIYDYRHGDRF